VTEQPRAELAHVTIEQQIAAVKRDLFHRESKFFPRLIQSGKMTQGEARVQIDTLKAVLVTLERVQAGVGRVDTLAKPQPNPLDNLLGPVVGILALVRDAVAAGRAGDMQRAVEALAECAALNVGYNFLYDRPGEAPRIVSLDGKKEFRG